MEICRLGIADRILGFCPHAVPAVVLIAQDAEIVLRGTRRAGTLQLLRQPTIL
jgi:hypothetical protein